MKKYIDYKKIIISMAVLTFVFTAGLSNVQAKVMTDDYQNQENIKLAELVLESLEMSDYETWRKLVNPNSKLARKVSVEDFNDFIRARGLARQGDYEKALGILEKLRSGLGLNSKQVAEIRRELKLVL